MLTVFQTQIFKLEVQSSPYSLLHSNMGMKHLDSLGMADSVRMCSSWVLQQQARLGTTFPPFTNQLTCAHMLVNNMEVTNSRCLSEPNLIKYEDFGDQMSPEEDEGDHQPCSKQEEDEDYLFEFDLDSHDSSDTGDEEEGEHASGEQRLAEQESEKLVGEVDGIKT